ncbi:hypothetical protein [Comamonas testosteroni]|uniref:Membrane protein n=1 Tax=Comamonas testosteroni TaxID=285 RepID=A0A096GJY4_COMTE|nr:hypothetical protein [Comamonas testosteroni]KGH25475.1 membrane protein [Comamonas testosteroni]
MQESNVNKLGLTAVVAAAAMSLAPAAQAADFVKLQFSDGRPDVHGLENVNAVLRAVGVRASTVAIPDAVKPILKASQTRATSDEEQKTLLKTFVLNRAQLLEQIHLAGRTPEVARGGLLGTREGDTAPYPKVYDMKAMTPDMQTWALNRYGRLHVNSSDAGPGIDEVMTVVSGGPFTWMYILPDATVARLTVDRIAENGPAVRLSYPGMGTHAGYMDPKDGLIVAYAHGPESFVIRFDESTAPHAELLNTNPWVDFTGLVPTLRTKVN